jgi:low affinity Fe/Cu permease
MEEETFDFKNVDVDILLRMREELEKEYVGYDDDDKEELEKAIDTINTMCYYKIKKEQEEKEKLLIKKIEEIKVSNS